MYPNDNNNLHPHLLKGLFKQFSPKPPAEPPIFQRSIQLGENARDDQFSVLRLRVLKPTTQYPRIGIHLQLKNASGSAFTNIAFDELAQLRDYINKWCEEIAPLMPQLEQQRDALIQQQINEYQQQANIQYLEKLQQIVESNGNDDESDIRPNYRNSKGQFTRGLYQDER
jgi:hypothetical protein